MIVSRWVWSWAGFTETPAWGSLYRNWAVPLSTTMSDLFIRIFFKLTGKDYSSRRKCASFLLDNDIADTNPGILSFTSSCKEKFTWMAVFLFLGLWVLSCLIRGDGLSFVVLFVTKQIQMHPKDAGEDKLQCLGWQWLVGRKKGRTSPSSSSACMF